MSINTRMSALENRFDSVEASIARQEAMLTALLDAKAPAKAVVTPAAPKARKASRKAVTVEAPLAKAVRQTRATGGTLSRKEWNDTLSAKARLAGKNAEGVSWYRVVMNDWAAVRDCRVAGMTPAEVLAIVMAG